MEEDKTFQSIKISENNNNNNNDNENNYDYDFDSINKIEEKFENVSKELEGQSIKFREIDGGLNNNRDIELGERRHENEEDFKLRQYFEDSQRQKMLINHKPKKMGVSIKNLTVVGQGADNSVIVDNSTPFKALGKLLNPFNYFNKDKNKINTFNILNEINAFIEDGKMLLVLGRPGAGCSTLLRVISNQRESYISVNGDITYGNIPANDWSKYRGETIYTGEEDIHHPTLTVRETLDFTLKLKTPGSRLPEESKRNFRTKIYELLVSMFGLVNQGDTMVGNEYVRGLSGGERKRMTITEAMVSGSSITCWDCSTRGLDAASAFDYAKSLRIMSDTLDKTTIASFYQASDSIYNLFDKVLVLDKGRCIYFGPISLAKQYFLNLGFDCEPRKSIPDFLTGITNPQERIIKSGFEGRVPETSADLEEEWKKSELFQTMKQAQLEYEKQVEQQQPSIDFKEQVLNEKSRTTSKNSEYSSSFFAQTIALTQRQLSLTWGDKFTLTSRFLTILVLSFIFGGIYFQQPLTTDGLFTRGGAMFSSIIFNCILTQGELHHSFVGRRILQKHKSYALYRPSAYFVSQILIDLPFIFVQVFLHSFIVYFMYGLDYRADKFFIFCFTLIGVSLSSASLFRGFANFTPSLFTAQNLMNFVFIFEVNYFGYSQTPDKMHSWFKWTYYINPLAYAFKSLMVNEFKGLEFSCFESAIPFDPINNTTYSDFNHRICPIPGSVEGSLFVKGEDYLSNALQINNGHRSLDVVTIYLFWLFYIALNIFAVEYFDWTSGGYTHKVYKRGKAPKLNDVEEEKNQNQIVKKATDNMKDTLKMRGGLFSWKSISYTVPIAGTNKLLLDDVMGWIKPGQMTALMGSSGAGKTTLLDVLAKRKTMGTVSGESLLNGKPLEIDFERITGYVEQMDVHNPGLTVREALRFSAKLRQEPWVPLNEKYQYVEHVLEMMEMKHLGDALIGTLETGVGISVEERKRLTIGLELVAKPHILYLDEPTSGLDSQSSYNIIRFIRKLADAGMPLVCTIHQPSSVLFEHFDRILLLARGGKTVYFGDIGEKSKTLTSYFERYGVRPCTDDENPAEYILEATGAGISGKTNVDWPTVWKESSEYQDVLNELDRLRTKQELDKYIIESESEQHSGQLQAPPREFANGFLTQFIEVYKRLNIIYYRDVYYTMGSFAQSAISGLVIGFTFYDLQNSSSDQQQRIFMSWEAMILGVLLIYLVLPMFFIQKEYFKRDTASKYYSWHAFSLAMIAVEIPYVVLSSTLFFITTYWTSGIDSTASSNFYYWLMHTMFSVYIVSFAQALGAACVNIAISIAALPLVLFYIFLLCGVQVPPPTMSSFYQDWLYHLNPAKYFLEGLITTVLKPINVLCTDVDLIKFTAPTGLNCSTYSAPFLESATGYVVSTNTTTNECGYCIYSKGEDYYETNLGWDYNHRWRNFGIIVAYWASSILAVLFFVYLTQKPRR
ncbi:hypothetical protein RB653_010565 [Dictyostelium firmibasis]|uniref:ABC transporter domain-containing protein n=1 Tax=Dictyostelium firmibasis TaxID=79012 RepID=A0AAN7TT25_9MYCE